MVKCLGHHVKANNYLSMHREFNISARNLRFKQMNAIVEF